MTKYTTTIEERAAELIRPDRDDCVMVLPSALVAFAHRERAAAIRDAADLLPPELWTLAHIIRALADAEERLANV